MKSFLLAVIVICFSTTLSAQIPKHDKTVDKKFLFVNGFYVSATVFDVESTFAALDKCNHTCKEGNPLMKPLFNLGRPAVYAVEGGLNAAVIYATYKFKRKGSKWWWVAPVAVGAVHTIAGGFNLRFAINP